MGALSALAGGGAPSVSASSSASSGPQSGTTGSLVLNFGGINLGNEDIPLNANTTSATNQPATVGTTFTPGTGAAIVSGAAQYLPYILAAGALIALFVWLKNR